MSNHEKKGYSAMNTSFQDELARLANPTLAATISQATTKLATSMAEILASVSPSDAKWLLSLVMRALVTEIDTINRTAESAVDRRLDSHCPSPESAGVVVTLPSSQAGFLAKTPVPPEVAQRALRDFDETETTERIRQIRESGGLVLSDFYEELEQLILPSE
jgi:hypothetical protein